MRGSKSKKVPAMDAGEYLGHYIEFLVHISWEEESYQLRGKLVGVSRTDPADQDQLTYLSVASEEDEAHGYYIGSLGAYGMSHTNLIRVFL